MFTRRRPSLVEWVGLLGAMLGLNVFGEEDLYLQIEVLLTKYIQTKHGNNWWTLSSQRLELSRPDGLQQHRGSGR